ncbi:pirin family protein [Planctobacterium marinum]|uniref:hypothetical protein n=1 Tax=Planctobacterium marinum TaxID=1631968 RepID=UPI001E65D432|nr:hypothetical protein [Planctobacterium marinum]MCC2607472.1 hypothetical protein [Planctobacterium marinum]
MGILISERETIETRGKDHVLNGLQCWVALPEDKTEMEPSFLHINRSALPYIHRENILMRLIAGEAYNYTSPVKTYSPMFYLDAITEVGAVVERPCAESETACYVISGTVKIGDEAFEAGQFVMLENEESIETPGPVDLWCIDFVLNKRVLIEKQLYRHSGPTSKSCDNE